MRNEIRNIIQSCCSVYGNAVGKCGDISITREDLEDINNEMRVAVEVATDEICTIVLDKVNKKIHGGNDEQMSQVRVRT